MRVRIMSAVIQKRNALIFQQVYKPDKNQLSNEIHLFVMKKKQKTRQIVKSDHNQNVQRLCEITDAHNIIDRP